MKNEGEKKREGWFKVLEAERSLQWCLWFLWQREDILFLMSHSLYSLPLGLSLSPPLSPSLVSIRLSDPVFFLLLHLSSSSGTLSTNLLPFSECYYCLPFFLLVVRNLQAVGSDYAVIDILSCLTTPCQKPEHVREQGHAALRLPLSLSRAFSIFMQRYCVLL